MNEDPFDLFSKKLSLQEAFQYDSLIDNGHYDPHLILLTTMMNNPDYVPSSDASKNIMEHLRAEKKPVEERKPEPKPEPKPETQPKPKTENKNKRKTYIKLPDAITKVHKHKFQQSNNEKPVKNTGESRTGKSRTGDTATGTDSRGTDIN